MASLIDAHARGRRLQDLPRGHDLDLILQFASGPVRDTRNEVIPEIVVRRGFASRLARRDRRVLGILDTK